MKRLISERFGMVLILTGLIIIPVSIYMFSRYRIFNTRLPIDADLFDKYGSFLAGAVGSLWALAGVILFYVALKDQRKDFETNRQNLELQREELKLNTEELAAQRVEFEKQNETLVKQYETLQHQQFESTFFNLFQMFHNLKESLVHNEFHVSRVYKGSAYFIMCDELLNNIFKHAIAKDYNNYVVKATSGKDFKVIENKYGINDAQKLNDFDVKHKAAYRYMSKQEHVKLDHYFRSLYQILKFVWMNELREKSSIEVLYVNDNAKKKMLQRDIERKYKQYTEFLQAQSSSSEMLLLFYNALFFPKMRHFIYHYDLLENLSVEDLLEPDHKVFYSGEKFNSYNYGGIEFKSKSENINI